VHVLSPIEWTLIVSVVVVIVASLVFLR